MFLHLTSPHNCCGCLNKFLPTDGVISPLLVYCVFQIAANVAHLSKPGGMLKKNTLLHRAPAEPQQHKHFSVKEPIWRRKPSAGR